MFLKILPNGAEETRFWCSAPETEKRDPPARARTDWCSGVPETAQTLKKNVSRAQALRARVFLHVFTKHKQKRYQHGLFFPAEILPFLYVFTFLRPGVPKDSQKGAQSRQKGAKSAKIKPQSEAELKISVGNILKKNKT